MDGGEYDSFLTHKKAHPTQMFIREHGLEKFLKQQKRRIRLLETMLNDYDDGRSKSYYCIAATLLPIADLEKALDKAKQKIKSDKIRTDDIKTTSQILKGFLNDVATTKRIELKLRKKGKSNERK